MTTTETDTSFRWHGPLSPDQTVSIDGINGNIHAVAASGREIEVTAVKRGSRRDFEKVKIEVVEEQNGVVIRAVYPKTVLSGSAININVNGWNIISTKGTDVAVDFVARVPAGVRFRGHTVNGEGSVKNLTADTEVEVVNGQVRASIGSERTGTLRLATVNGDVRVEASAKASMQVSAETTNGVIESDFPLRTEGDVGPRYATGTIGNDSRSSLQLSTVNGGVYIRRVD